MKHTKITKLLTVTAMTCLLATGFAVTNVKAAKIS